MVWIWDKQWLSWRNNIGGSLNILVPFCSTSAKSGVPLYPYIANQKTKFPEGQSSSQPGIIILLTKWDQKRI